MIKYEIPNVPPPKKIPEKIAEKVNNWINFFKAMSPRIRVITPLDEDFDLQKFENFAKDAAADDVDYKEIELIDWPDKSMVAFIVTFDSAFPGHKAEFLVMDTYVFCFGKRAFGLKYFERIEDSEREYSLLNFSNSALSWEYIAKIISDKITRIQIMVPDKPKTASS